MAFRKAKEVKLNTDEILVTRTYCYRIFGSYSKRFLNQRARNVNYVWNFLNRSAYEALECRKYWMNKADLQDITSGTSKLTNGDFGFEFAICSKSVQALAHKYHDARAANEVRAARPILNFRNGKNNGWIPFRPRDVDIKLPEDKGTYGHIRYCGEWVKFRMHRPLPSRHTLAQAEFCKDTAGHWNVHISVKFPIKIKAKTEISCGIDQNFSENKQIVLSDGTVFGRSNLTKLKEKQTNKIHTKIYRLKYNEEQRDLLDEKKCLTRLVYCHNSTDTDEDKKVHLSRIKEIRIILKTIWIERKKTMSVGERHAAYRRLNKYYRILGKIEYRFERKRHDFQHKVSRMVADTYDEIYIGGALDNRFSRSRMARSFLDVAPSEFKFLVKYKANGNGYLADDEINEAGTSLSCSGCLEPTGPRGIEGLGVRSWICSSCGARHDRDINAAILIKLVGKGEIGYEYTLKRFIRKKGVGSDTSDTQRVS